MPGTENAYRLVLFDVPDDPLAVRDLLGRVAGVHPTDAMQWIARAPGILPRPLAEPEVRALLDGLYELGIAAEAWRADALPVLAPARSIHDAACLDDGFRVRGLRGEPTHWVPWPKIDLICAGKVAAEDEYRAVVPPGWVSAVSTGLNALIGRAPAAARRQRALRIARDPVGEVIIVRRDPRITFRAAATALNYAYLGDRLRPAAAENFPLFLADLCRRATAAYVTPSTRALLDGGKADEPLFASSQALLDHATLRLLWSWYRRDRDDPGRTQL